MIEQPCPQCAKKEFLIEILLDREFLLRCASCKTAIWIIDITALKSISMKLWEAKEFIERFSKKK